MRSNMLHLAFASILASVLLACGGGRTSDPGQPVHVEAPAPDDPHGEPVGDAEDPPPTGDEVDDGGDGDLVVGDDPCETDEDCVPAECCHAAACVSQQNAPDCGSAMCTQDCQYGTLDCGGACLCHEGRCAARLSEPPAGLP